MCKCKMVINDGMDEKMYAFIKFFLCTAFFSYLWFILHFKDAGGLNTNWYPRLMFFFLN
jgi:hypothetical protein